MGFNFGAFAGGVAKGINEGQKMHLEAEAHKLKAKMLKMQMDAAEFDQGEKVRKAGEQAQQQVELGRFVDMLGKGVPQQVTPGFEDPQQQMSIAPVESNFRPANPQELLGQSLKSIGPEHRFNLIQESMKAREKKQPLHFAPGTMLEDINAPGGFRQVGMPKEPGGKTQLTADQIGTLFPDLPAERRAIIASLPGEAQERTLDNLRSSSGQAATEERFNKSQERIGQQFQQTLTARDATEQRRESAQTKRQESGLRSEHQRQSKNFVTQRNNLAELEASSKGGAVADHSLIFKYLKVLDPTSTVREGEFATVRDTTGLPDRVKNYLSQIWKGTKLNPQQRKEIVEQSRAQFGVAKLHQDQLDSEYRRLAAGQGIDPDRVVIDYTAPQTRAPVPGAPAKAGASKEERLKGLGF